MESLLSQTSTDRLNSNRNFEFEVHNKTKIYFNFVTKTLVFLKYFIILFTEFR